MLPKEAIQEFKKLYLTRFGVELTDEEASRRANNLVSLYKFVYDKPVPGPIKNNDYQKQSQTTWIITPGVFHDISGQQIT